MSTLDYLILMGIAIITACIVVWMIRKKRRCRGSCAGCPYSGLCGK